MEMGISGKWGGTDLVWGGTFGGTFWLSVALSGVVGGLVSLSEELPGGSTCRVLAEHRGSTLELAVVASCQPQSPAPEGTWTQRSGTASVSFQYRFSTVSVPLPGRCSASF